MEKYLVLFSDMNMESHPIPNSSDSDETPKEFVILKMGDNPYRINGEEGSFSVDETDMNNIVNTFKKQGNPIPVDYDHSTLKPELASKGDAGASGWLKDLIFNPEKGLIAVVDFWTNKAKQAIINKEYRYFSPVLSFNTLTKRPEFVHSCALTNHPALYNCPALIAASDLGIDTFSPIKKLQEVIESAVASGRKVEQILIDSFKEYSELVKDNPQAMSEMMAFSDANMLDIFQPNNANSVQTPAPVQVDASVSSTSTPQPDTGSDTDIIYLVEEINTAKAGMSPDTFIKWLGKRRATATPIQLRIIDAAINDASKASNGSIELPSLAEQPVPIALSDIAVCIGHKALLNASEAKTELLALRNIKNDSANFLDKHQLKSFTDLDGMITNLQNENLSYKVNILLDELEADGKIVASQKESLKDTAKRDFKAFSDITKNMPKIYNLNTGKDQIKPFNSGSIKVPAIYSDEEIMIANSFGKNPEELYKR